MISGFTTNLAVADEALTIDANGNVGIGTTSPAAKLDVAGDIRTNGAKPVKYVGFSGNTRTNYNTGYSHTEFSVAVIASWDSKNSDPWNGLVKDSNGKWHVRSAGGFDSMNIVFFRNEISE